MYQYIFFWKLRCYRYYSFFKLCKECIAYNKSFLIFTLNAFIHHFKIKSLQVDYVIQIIQKMFAFLNIKYDNNI